VYDLIIALKVHWQF